MSNIEYLRSEVSRINCLINETNVLIHSPVSTMAADLKGYLEKNSSTLGKVVWNNMRNMTNKGRLDTIIVAVGVMGVAYVGAKAIDITRDAIAHQKADQKLKAYYQQLTVKQNQLIEAQQNIILQLSRSVDLLEAERNEIQKTVTRMAETISKIMQITENRVV